MTDENDANGNENSGANSNEQQNQPQGNGLVLDDATIDRIAAASRRGAADQVRDDQRNGGQNNDAQSNHSSGNNDALLTAIQALPETVVRAVKEAVGVPQQPKNDAGNNDQKNDAGSNENNSGDQPGKYKSFAHMWFGIK